MALVSESTDATWQVRLDMQRIDDFPSLVCDNCYPEVSSVAECYWIRVQDDGYRLIELCTGCQRQVATVLGPDAIVPEDSTLSKLLHGALAHELKTHPRTQETSADLPDLDELPF